MVLPRSLSTAGLELRCFHIRHVLLRTLAILLPVALLIAALVFRTYTLERDHEVDILKQTAHARLMLDSRHLMASMRAVMLTMYSLKAYPAMTTLLTDPGTHDGLQAEYEARLTLLALAKAHPDYAQVRLLDRYGRERVRVDRRNGKATVASRSELQDKSRRYYFKQTEALQTGGVYISPLDLNVEHGQVEVPHHPMLRFGMPLDGPDGIRVGVLIINYDAGRMLDKLGAVGREIGSDGVAIGMINSKGYWLKGLEPGSEWGFQLPDRAQRTFQNEYPRQWRALRDSPDGQVVAEQGLFTMLTIDPSLAFDTQSDWARVGTGEKASEACDERQKTQGGSEGVKCPELWRLVSLTSVSQGNLFITSGYAVSLMVLLVVFGVAAFGLSLAYERRKAGLERIREQYDALSLAEGKLRAIMEASFDALIIVDSAGHVEYWSDTAVRMFGYTVAEARGQEVHGLLATEQDRETAKAGLRLFAETGTGAAIGTEHEFTARRRNGDEFPVELSLATIDYGGERLAVATVRDISERKRAQRRLEELATTDGLTGLFNRRHFMERGEAEVHRAGRYATPLSVLMFDVDHFKSVNDTYGHDGGDEVLRRIAHICRDSFREEDVVGRIGGEEFAVVLPTADGAMAVSVADRLRLTMEAAAVESGPDTIRFTISLGVAEYGQGGEAETDSLDLMLKRADEALYAAKRTGRNKVVRHGAGAESGAG